MSSKELLLVYFYFMLLGIALCVESVSMANVRYIYIVVLHTYNAMKNGLSGTSRLRVRSEKIYKHVYYYVVDMF